MCKKTSYPSENSAKTFKKSIAIFMLFVMIITLFSGIVWAADDQVEFDPKTDYMALMIAAALNHDYDTVEVLNEKRNAKIIATDAPYPILTADEFRADFEQYAGFSMYEDYMDIMIRCCVNRQDEYGRQAEVRRNRKINAIHSAYPKVSYDELCMLARILTWECGSSWLSYEWKMSVGEVLLNRVASPEFPDTLEGCLYQRGQYQGVGSYAFEETYPYEDCTRIAAKLLSGERVLYEPAVVFQANFPQGGGVYRTLTDSYLGTTYLCYSNNIYLYE